MSGQRATRRESDLKILMFVPQYPPPATGGLEKQAHELARALVARGIRVEVLSGRFRPAQSRLDEVDGVVVRRIFWPRNKFLRSVWAPIGLAIAGWGMARRADVVHVHQHSGVGLYVMALARLAGKPVIAKLPSQGVFGIPGMRDLPFGGLRLRILLSSDAIVSMSRESREEVLATGYPESRVFATYNGINLAPFSPRRDDLDSGVARVIFVGRMTEEKMLHVLLRAWKRVRNEAGVPVSLELLGDGVLRGELERLCAEWGLEDVGFSGHVTDIPRRLGEADVFVLPSRIEGNSNAVLEAMAAGLPIVSTPVGGTPTQVGEAGAPFLCAVADADALAAAMLPLIRDPALRRATGAAMRRRAESLFNINRIAEGYAQAYLLLQSGRRDEVATISCAVRQGEG